MVSAKVVLIGFAGVLVWYYGVKPVAKASVKTSHAICHVVTLGKKCK